MKPLTFILGILCLFSASGGLATPERELKERLQDYLAREYPSVGQSPVSSGILYDLVAPISGLSAVDGSSDSVAVTLERWLQFGHELRRASLAPSLIPPHQQLRGIGIQSAREQVYPIAFLDYRYHSIRPDADSTEILGFDGDRIVSLTSDALEEKRAFSASVLRDWSYRGSSVRFRIDRGNFYFANDPIPLSSLRIDFDDGLGFREAAGDAVVSYDETGMKTVRVQVLHENGRILRSAFRFDVRSLDTPDPTEIWQVDAAIPHNGNYSSGEAYVYLSDQHTTLTNPIILAEGIDLDDSRNWDELYDMLNQENLLEDVRALGFDAVVLNHDNGTDYIQGNAYLLVELINQVNALIPESASIVLVGTSMGGLTSRYALSYMESNDLPHNVELWISFDAPHKGADIPLGLQYWVDFFAGQAAEAEQYRDALNSPAARQLLVAHFTSPPTANVSADPLRADFNNELSQIGDFPALSRTVALANGSGSMTGLDFNPGDQLIQWEYGSFLVDITGNSWSLNDLQTNVIFQGEIDQIWPLPDESRTVTVNPTWPWDNAPGGRTNSMQEMGNVNPGFGDIIALHTHHCFIPTISSLALAVSDPFYDIAGAANLYALTPFDTLYYPTWNQSHSVVVPENYGWLLGELLNTIPPPAITLTPADLAFDPTPVGQARQQLLTISNDRSWPTVIDGLDLLQGESFALVSAPALPETLDAVGTQQIAVRFLPLAEGDFRDTLLIAFDGQTVALPISGAGVESHLVLSTEEIDFSIVHVDSLEAREFSITNSGSAPLQITDVTVSDAAFELSLLTPVLAARTEPDLHQGTPDKSSLKQRDRDALDEITFVLHPGESQHIIVSFLPVEEAEYEASILVFATDTIAEIALLGQGAAQHIAIDSDTLSFASLEVGEQALLALAVSNSGLWNLSIDSIAFALDNRFGLSPIPFWPDVVFSQSEAIYWISFAPDDTGSFENTLTVYHDAGEPVAVHLSGAAVQARIALRPDTLRFGDVWTGAAAADSLWIINEGTAPLSIDEIIPDLEPFTAGQFDSEIQPADSMAVTVSFMPTDTLAYSGLLEIASNVGNHSVALAGRGIWTELVIEPAILLFENAALDSTISRSLLLRSAGNAPITGIAASLIVGSAFQIVSPSPTTIFAYGIDSLIIAFAAVTNGVFEDTLVITSGLDETYLIPLAADVPSALSRADRLLPDDFYLAQNYPNPFNPSTTLEFGLPHSESITLRVYDALGRQVDEPLHAEMPAGRHRIEWSCSSCASGLYFFVLTTPDSQFMKKAMLLH